MERFRFYVRGRTCFCLFNIRKRKGVTYVEIKDDPNNREYSVMVACEIILPLIRFEIGEPYENIVFYYIDAERKYWQLSVKKDGGVGWKKIKPIRFWTRRKKKQ